MQAATGDSSVASFAPRAMSGDAFAGSLGATTLHELTKRSEKKCCHRMTASVGSNASVQVTPYAQAQAVQPSTQQITQPSDKLMDVFGRVWELSSEAEGCRHVQAALEACGEGQDVQFALVAELKGHVWEAIRCPHANYVLQRCITALHTDASQFILVEVLQHGPGAVAQVARHRFGCRVLERLLERYSKAKLRPLVEELMAEAVALAKHAYGNYVIQHALKHGPSDQRQRLTEILEHHLPVLASDRFGSAVLVRALSTGDVSARLAFARRATATQGLLAALARSRHGYAATRIVLQLLGTLPADEAVAVREALVKTGRHTSSKARPAHFLYSGDRAGP